VYYEQQNGEMYRKKPDAPVRWGRDSGRRITPRAEDGAPPLRFSWSTPLFASHHADDVLYCATQYAMRSPDRGDSWERISEDLTGNRGAIVSFGESPLDAQRLITGAGRAGVFLTADRGASWQAAGEGLPPKPVCGVRASAHDPERVYVCLSDAAAGDRRAYLFESRDYGRSWKSLSDSLSAEPVKVLVEDPVEEGILYLGTNLGVYVSIDDGAHWHSLCRGLPTALVVDMMVHPTDRAHARHRHPRSERLRDGRPAHSRGQVRAVIPALTSARPAGSFVSGSPWGRPRSRRLRPRRELDHDGNTGAAMHLSAKDGRIVETCAICSCC